MVQMCVASILLVYPTVALAPVAVTTSQCEVNDYPSLDSVERFE